MVRLGLPIPSGLTHSTLALMEFSPHTRRPIPRFPFPSVYLSTEGNYIFIDPKCRYAPAVLTWTLSYTVHAV
jgi:hypothetical protein